MWTILGRECSAPSPLRAADQAFLQEQGDGDAVVGILSALSDDFSRWGAESGSGSGFGEEERVGFLRPCRYGWVGGSSWKEKGHQVDKC